MTDVATPPRATRMYSIHIGSAALPPTSLLPSGWDLSKPTQAMAAILVLKPANQASCCSLVVPVLPAKSLRPSAR